jgi:hypothetical protein
VLDGRTASATMRRSPREGEDPELLVVEQRLPLTDLSDGERVDARDAQATPT